MEASVDIPHEENGPDIARLLELVQKYLSEAACKTLKAAVQLAAEAHEGQRRASGEPYITHPIACAEILAEHQVEPNTLYATILHDVLEDCEEEKKESFRRRIAAEFSDDVLSLVEGVTNLPTKRLLEDEGKESETGSKRIVEQRRKKREEDLKKLLVAIARDLRVILIKLADRLHNMRTLHYLPEDRWAANARETQTVYAPLAHRLGLWKIKWQLEDLAFKYLHPAEYEELVAKVQKTREQREEEIERAKEILERRLAEAGIEAEVQGRPKHLWSIYTKMQREDVDFGDIYDLIALRIIVKTVPDCYHALGVVNELFVPLPGRFYDYIARPKPNMYQSLHQKLIGPTMEPMEIQIRTHEMHRTAEFGIAAHWSYKEGRPDNGEFAKRLDFMRSQLFEWHDEIGSASEFLRQAVEQLFSDQVFVFTPQGDIVDLPVGATPIDFAYRIHTELGNHMVGARVSGKIVPLSYRFDTTLLDQRPPFHNGDVVEIVSRPQATPGIDWAHIAKTSYARNKIRAFFRKKNRAELEAHGREIFFKELRQQRLGDGEMNPQHFAARAAEILNYHDVEDMFVAIGNGSVSPITVVNRVKSEMPIERTDVLQVGALHTEQKIEIVAGGVSNVEYRRSRCCLPLPGDDVVGFVTRGRGISLHRRGCGALASLAGEEKARLIDVDWKASGHFSTDVVIEAMDRVGLLGDISHLFSGAQVNIESARIASRRGQTAQLRLTVDVRDVDQLNQLIQSLLAIPDVLYVYRLGQGPMPPRVAS